MLHFRKMEIDDFKYIYSNDYLKPLLTVPPIGEKFGILIDEDGRIKGGLTGYTDGQGAMIQLIRVDEGAQHFQLKEGLLRAAVYMLDRESIKIIFTKDDLDNSFSRIGFCKIDHLNNLTYGEFGELIADDIGRHSFGYLDVDNFFKHSCGS